MDSQTPMMRQYLEIKGRHPDKLLFFRLGDFYEMFFEDAVEASRALEITLTSRNNDREGKPIPMCGVPHHAVNGYLARLIKSGYKVALCEQVEDPRAAKGIVRREVVRVVTPGTTIEEGTLETRENNYMAALAEWDGRVGAAFLDLSTGEFWFSQTEGGEAWPEMAQIVAHFRPSELVLPESEAGRLRGRLDGGQPEAVETSQPDWTFQADYAARALLDHFGVTALDGFGAEGRRAGVAAAGALLQYVRQTQRAALGHVTSLRLFEAARFLRLDESTVGNLELVRGADGNRKWTLLSVVDQTRTAMGGRLLRSWMLRPSLDLEEIEARLDAVEELRGSALALGRLADTLSRIRDLERLLGRVTLEIANPRDLLALKESFQALPDLTAQLAERTSRLLRPGMDLLADAAETLEKSIRPDAPVSTADGGVIQSGFHPGLDELREVSQSGKSFIAKLEGRERERTGIANLKVKYNKVFGYFIEITKSQLGQVPDDYQRRQTLVNCERFATPELKEYEEKVLGAEERILELERELFAEVRRRVAAEAGRIRATAARVAEIDALASLARAALDNRYARPTLDRSLELEIAEGRHPVLERQAGEPFVPNDLKCNCDDRQMLILTGPNMGGKSTYLRQNALIVILAQMGSFVPASSARIGLVDRIYTRVGASDNLARGRSTFMVEMIETANILNTATPRSFILLDEVGRGTATFDGLSLAWSIAEYLHTEPSRRARTLFATHYHELTKLEGLYDGVKNCCVSVRESDGRIIFFHRVMPGVANRSYGIEVARLAGLPAPVLARAREVLTRLERKQLNLAGTKSAARESALDGLQKALF